MANADTTKAMQEALEAAVARMNSASPDQRPPGPDLMSTLMALAPRLLQSTGNGQEMLERLETLRKGEIAGIREQVQILRKQCFRMLKFQEQLLVKVHEIQRQQVAAAGAVLDLAQQMARLTIVEDDEVDQVVEHEPDRSVGAYGADIRTRTNGNGRHTNRT